MKNEDCLPEEHTPSECSKHLLPVRDALEMLSGKWKIPIIIALSFGNRRFKELHRQIGITPKMLSKELKELEMHQLVRRTVYDSTPVTVEYELTPYAESLHPVIEALKDWGSKHRKRLMGKNKTAA
ncbi:MAG: helix-turn-helix transcriptional regulator [Taibaiella sp.]|nr:helix-turn-helix transcriptional regulator [Taibaiella sp.]